MSSPAWLRSFGLEVDRGDRPRLIVMPHAGGAATYYRPLAMALAGEMDVLVVQYPGRQDRRREPPLTTIAGLVAGLIPEVEALNRSVPTVLFGHSMGSIVAYELAKESQRLGLLNLVGLAVSGRNPPSVYGDSSRHTASDADLINELRALDGSQGQLLDDPEICAIVLPPLRADYHAIWSYRDAEHVRLRCPIAVLHGSEDPRISSQSLSVWSEYSERETTFLEFPGGHFYVQTSVSDLALYLTKLVPALAAAAFR